MQSVHTESTAFRKLRTSAIAEWQDAARAIAAGGDPPSPTAILEWGAILGIPGPMAELENDSNGIMEAQELEQRAAATKARLDAQVADAGGVAAIRARLAEIAAEKRRLEPLVSGNHWSNWTAVCSQLSTVRRKHPRVFPEPTVKAAIPSPAVKASKARRATKVSDDYGDD